MAYTKEQLMAMAESADRHQFQGTVQAAKLRELAVLCWQQSVRIQELESKQKEAQA